MSTPKNIYINYHAKTYLPQFWYFMYGFQNCKTKLQKNIEDAKRQKKKDWTDKAGIRSILLIRHRLPERKHKVNMINMLRALNLEKK